MSVELWKLSTTDLARRLVSIRKGLYPSKSSGPRIAREIRWRVPFGYLIVWSERLFGFRKN